MKNFILGVFALIVSSVALYSCRSDEEKPSVVGTWEAVEQTINGKKNDDINVCPTQKDYVTFRNDGTGIHVDFDDNCNPNEDKFTYQVSGNTLRMTEERGLINYIIKELTATSLVMEAHIDETGDGKVDSIVRLVLRKK